VVDDSSGKVLAALHLKCWYAKAIEEMIIFDVTLLDFHFGERLLAGQHCIGRISKL
jgi:hypothetical protein